MITNQHLKKPARQSVIELPAGVRFTKPSVAWEQLNHAQDTLLGLKNICKEFKPGQGQMCLFVGGLRESQSLASQAIAKQLGKPLMYNDLAAIVSKYIGETEKNLNRVFDAAEMQDAVLFFDEADALFGKRTDVKDLHDRYANIDTNALLQRIEAFKGLVILTSKSKQPLDNAFMRRIGHVIHFPA